MATDLESVIATAAAAPQSVKTDAAEVKAQPLQDLIATDQHLANKAAGSNPAPIKTAIRFGRCIPPGAV